MGNLYFGITMFICLVPMVWIMLFYLYPKKWNERKQIFGVNNRKEFQQDGVKEEVESIAQKGRKRALLIALITTAISVALLLLHGIFMQTFIWTSFIFVAIFIITVPFLLGHKEMMTVKKSLGLTQEKGISFVDLKTAGNVHALKAGRALLPNLAGLLITGLMLLADLGVIRFKAYAPGSFFGTILAVTMFLMGLLITLCGFLMDRLKNDVISTDSDINANYNRAKKKNWADLMVAFLWLNVAYMLISAFILLIAYSNLLATGFLLLYLILMVVGVAVFAGRGRKIEERYRKETTVITDDDEYWLGGMIYCNPNDRRVLVEKRAGIGSTINMGHPAGKVIGIITLILLLNVFASLIYVGLIEATPISLRAENGTLICHQLKDEYVITPDM
ncbi:MAG: DUF5808 domain-containing protein, partial [Lachnospiraceae bacterium]|nr:DUF5808 domain-containing protein [Lachnospiraceae bacterium]